jgi:hypothetical protein
MTLLFRCSRQPFTLHKKKFKSSIIKRPARIASNLPVDISLQSMLRNLSQSWLLVLQTVLSAIHEEGARSSDLDFRSFFFGLPPALGFGACPQTSLRPDRAKIE